MKEPKKNRISEEQFKKLLIKELAKKDSKANLKTNFFQLLQTKYSIDKTRALRLHDKYYSEYQNLENNELEAQTIEAEKEALKTALNDKNEHAQKLIDEIEQLKLIIAGRNIRVGDTIIVATFQDEIRAKAEIRAIRTQIGKWYGFEAPIKNELTGKNGEELKSAVLVVNGKAKYAPVMDEADITED